MAGAMPSDEVMEKSCALYVPGHSRTYGPLEWPGLLRMPDRTDPGFRV